LPDSITAYLEEPVSARGKVEVLQYTPLPGYESEVPQTSYRTTVGHSIYSSYFAGATPTKSGNGDIVVGMAVGPTLVHFAAPPILDPEEAADLIKAGKVRTDAICPASGKAATHPAVVDLGGSYRTFCSVEHAAAFQGQYVLATAAAEASTLEQSAAQASLAVPIFAPTAGQQGRQKLLVIPVAYADDPRPPSSQDALVNGARSNNQYYED